MELGCSRERTEGRNPRLRMSESGRPGKLDSEMVQNGGGSSSGNKAVRSRRHSHDFAALTVNKLRDELKRRGLPLHGKKAALISRLEAFELKMQPDSEVRGRKRSGHADANGDSVAPSSSVKLARDRMEEQRDRASVVLWRRPLTTLYYFVLETLTLTQEFLYKLWRNKTVVAFAVITFLAFFALYRINGPHQKYVAIFQKEFLWCAYWVGLGILSSVGLGTGLHTFLLYLGPHIAAVTLAAFECMSVDFPAPPYPEDIICPETEGTSMSLWTIMGKVRVEAFMWGAGTAIGELPPYFMARAARLSGQMDEDEAELEELIQGRQSAEKLSFLDRAKVTVHDLVQRVGFIGILLCASIPNPLFDLAGITCGHFLVPFWTFFGATLIGKAIIKMHIQKLFVIFVFSEHHVHQVVSLIKYIPHFGPKLQAPFKEYLEKQKAKMHIKPGTRVPTSTSWLSWLFEKVVMVMVIYFVLSIVNSMAQNYHKRQSKRKQEVSDRKVSKD